jgi:predicted RNA binding protein YcfA (HicA-like mRNA interferase family)
VAERYDDDQLLHWHRYPGNIEARELMKAAEARGWRYLRTAGSHAIYRLATETLSIPVNVAANGTKRDIIDTMLEATDEDGHDQPG